MADYVEDERARAAGLFLEDLGGVSWHEAPLPRRWHRCWPQTKGVVDATAVHRCACGAMRIPRFNGHWDDRNSRRKGSIA